MKSDKRRVQEQTYMMARLLVVLFLLFLSQTVLLSGEETSRSRRVTLKNRDDQQNPFSPKASLIRYWKKHISNSFPKPYFLISKASPLSAVEAAVFSNLAKRNQLSNRLSSFCSAANLLCSFDSTTSNRTKHLRDDDANFAVYTNKRFDNYGSASLGGADEFKNYSSNGVNFASDGFTRYSRTATGHGEKFASYSDEGNVVNTNFSSYGSASTGGSGEFSNYHRRVNVVNLGFAAYDANSNGHETSFAGYTAETNSGNEKFVSYGKNGNGVPVSFNGYGDSSNIVGSAFTGYGEEANSANDTFKTYTSNANNPNNNFKGYGQGGNSAVDEFSSYRSGANSGIDSFQSYAKNSNFAKVNFGNYGKTFSGAGIDNFREYGQGSSGQSVGFKVYGFNNTFKDYAKDGITFTGYKNTTTSFTTRKGNNIVNKWVEPGKFFRESELKSGTIMDMPDIRDEMPRRSFLPRSIVSNLPFSTSRLVQLKRIFHASPGSVVERVMVNALTECERNPSPGESKRCVGSIEDMIDFSTSVLGSNVVARTTENINGSGQKVMIGNVNGINDGNITKSVSCHQSLYPYLLYYCHSVPKVRVYTADILNVQSKVKMNNGVAICHLDTSDWSPGHGAFLALKSSPGLIEVCHWIFENDMNWTVADS